MSRDYRRRKEKEPYDDGYEIFKDRKLESYDRSKTRKQNKINLNTFSVEEDENPDCFFGHGHENFSEETSE